MRFILFLTCTLACSACVFPIKKSDSNSQNAGASGGSGAAPNTVAPQLISVSPTHGLISGGAFLLLNGSGFTPGMQVLVGGVACSYPPEISLFESSSAVGCITGAHAAGVVDVEMINSNGISTLLSNGYLYSSSSGYPAPSVTSISPASGPSIGDTLVTITGTGFLSGAVVNVGSGSCGSVSVLSSTQLTCITNGAGAGTDAVTVRNIDAQQGSLNNGFTYVSAPITSPAPTISGVAPASAGSNGGTTITLSGTGFLSGAVVRVGGVFCSSTHVVSANSITCVIPGAAPGAVTLEVQNTDTQSATLGSEFTYTLAPVYSSLAKYVFANNCTSCHGIGTYAGLMSTGWIVPGSALTSQLYIQMNGGSMPPGGGITASELSAIDTWIQNGAANN